jgi:hypothetical protein
MSPRCNQNCSGKRSRNIQGTRVSGTAAISSTFAVRQSANSFYHHRPYCRMNSCTQMAHRVVPQCPVGPGTFPSLPTSPFRDLVVNLLRLDVVARSRTRSLRVAVVVFVVIIVVVICLVVFLFIIFWLLSKEEIGRNPPISMA